MKILRKRCINNAEFPTVPICTRILTICEMLRTGQSRVCTGPGLSPALQCHLPSQHPVSCNYAAFGQFKGQKEVFIHVTWRLLHVKAILHRKGYTPP